MPMMCQLASEVKRGQEVLASARSVRTRFQRRGAPGDRPAASWEDHDQTAALRLLELQARHGGDLGRYRGAARKAVGLELSRALSRVSFPDNAEGRNYARDFQDAVPIAGCGHLEEESVHVPAFSLPDARIAWDERRAATARLLRLVASRLRKRAGQRWRALELLLGVGGEQAEDLAEAAWRTGATTQAVQAAIEELAKVVRSDREARRLRRLIASGMERL